MGKKKSVVIGFWYYIGMFMGVCRGPVNAIKALKVGDRIAPIGHRTNVVLKPFKLEYDFEPVEMVTSSGEYFINSSDLFGGESGEGGVWGTLDVMMGTQTQTAATRLKLMLGNMLPGFRGRLTVFFDGRFTALNPYPKKWAWRVWRTTEGWSANTPWYSSKATIVLADGQIHSMNGAHIIFEALTNREWGRGLPWNRLDQVAFQKAADQLWDEQFGLCIKWSRKDSVGNFISGIIEHIGGAVFTDRTNGLLTLKLIRNDYVFESLPRYDTTNGLLTITEAVVNSLPGQVNQVIVNYKDPIENKQGSVRTQSLAAIQASQGEINPMTKTYLGIPTGELALLAAQRDLDSMVLPLRRFNLTFDRRAWNIQPASVFRIANPARGLKDLVLRVVQIQDGTLANGTITMTCIQDQYSMPLTAFTTVQPPVWVPPNRDAELKRHRVFEMPYRDLAATLTPADLDYISDDGAVLGTVAEKPTPLSLSYDIAIKNGPPEPDEIPGP